MPEAEPSSSALQGRPQKKDFRSRAHSNVLNANDLWFPATPADVPSSEVLFIKGREREWAEEMAERCSRSAKWLISQQLG